MKLEAATSQALSHMSPEGRLSFAGNPLAALETLGMTVTPAESLRQRGDGGSCDGMSFLDDRVILYAPTDSRRKNFTLGHELGHFLVAEDDDLLDWLADLPDRRRVLEMLCDRIAQELLLPKALIDKTIGDGPVRARSLMDLFLATNASEPVCAIALACHLPSIGAVVIADRYENKVIHASIHPGNGEDWPQVFPWTGEDFPPQARLPVGRNSYSGRVTWTNRWGRRETYYGDAVATPTRVHLVLSSEDLWSCEPIHLLSQVAIDHRPVGIITCCGQCREVRGWPCSQCGEPSCPVCGKCGCDRALSEMALCSGCNMWVNRALVVNSLCVDCL